MDKVTQLTSKFFKPDYKHMLKNLTDIVKDIKHDIELMPDEYTDYGCDEPSVAIRLCVDDNDWIFRTGLSDFDQRHSRYCAASSIGLDTNPSELLEDLIDQILDQAGME